MYVFDAGLGSCRVWNSGGGGTGNLPGGVVPAFQGFRVQATGAAAAAGVHVLDVPTGRLAPGVYTVRLTASRDVRTQRRTVVR